MHFYHIHAALFFFAIGAVQSLQGMSCDVCVASLDCSNLTGTAGQYLSPSLLQQVKERYDSRVADPPYSHDEVFLTSKQYDDEPVNLIRNEGQHYSYT